MLKNILSQPVQIPDKLLDIVDLTKKFPLWFVANPGSGIVTVSIAFRYGGDLSDPQNKKGVSDFLSMALKEGTEKLDSQQLKRFFLEKNIQLSCSSGGDHFFIHFRTLKNSFQEATQCVLDMIQIPRFDEKDLNRLKSEEFVSLQQSLHSPEVVAQEKTRKCLFRENHPYSLSVEEKLLHLEGIQKEDLKAHTRKIFVRGALNVTICGDLSKEEIGTIFDSFYEALPEGDVPLFEKIELLGQGTMHHIPMKIPQTVIFFTHPGLDRLHPDFYALNLAFKAFAGGDFETRLMTEVRENRGLAYGCSGSLFSYALAHGFMGHTATKTESVQQVIGIIREEFQKLKEGLDKKKKGLTQEEFDFHKQSMIGSFPLSFESTEGVSKVMMSCLLEKLGIDYINKRSHLYNNLTLKNVNEAIERHIDPSKLMFVTLGEEEQVQKGGGGPL